MKEAVVTEEVTEAEAAPVLPVKEHDAIVEETIVTEEVKKSQAALRCSD